MANSKQEMKNKTIKLKEILLRSGMSARQFGKAFDIFESQVSNLLRGNRRTSRHYIETICESHTLYYCY